MVVTTIIVFGPLGIHTNNSFYIIMYSFKQHNNNNNNNNNNSNFFCANILENQAQWRDKTRGLINLIIESNA